MSWFYGIGIVIIWLSGVVLGYQAASDKQVAASETSTQSQVITRTTRTKTSKPDGSAKETEATTVTQVASTQAAVPGEPVASYLPRYSVAAVITPRADPDWYQPTGVELGIRVLGNLWATGSYSWLDKQVQLGARVEF